ncbi:tRNA lysidine(34) synthetase TilS [Candidatus Gromoviella agglomerans]|uniref:tRNA lysidine(34) synthetase TilS n=1 Tax=Candidatus Gromoviella agglomerans TaxID=2806609 RepID=UPI001E48DAC8|nr:tRNA lysidine(34) synthetase TilS [Candidatus Gromoviella agglomerans]
MLELQVYSEIALGQKIAIGVSGGVDSFVLLNMLLKFKPKDEIICVTVDHKLRKDSGESARFVSEMCKNLGIQCIVLNWNHGEISSDIQNRARKARYSLILQKCKDLKILFLYVAHHLNDQLETFMMRIKNGSGLLGLSCMMSSSYKSGINVIRPFLKIDKSFLIEFAVKNDIKWIEDSSNYNQLFARVRVRQEITKIDAQTLRRICEIISYCQNRAANCNFRINCILKEFSRLFFVNFNMIQNNIFSLLSKDINLLVSKFLTQRILMISLIGLSGLSKNDLRCLVRRISELVNQDYSAKSYADYEYIIGFLLNNSETKNALFDRCLWLKIEGNLLVFPRIIYSQSAVSLICESIDSQVNKSKIYIESSVYISKIRKCMVDSMNSDMSTADFRSSYDNFRTFFSKYIQSISEVNYLVRLIFLYIDCLYVDNAVHHVFYPTSISESIQFV